jgi:hypothetical protein
MVLEKVGETVVEHDGGRKVCWDGEPETANVLLNAEVGVVCRESHPFWRGGLGRV